MPESKMIEKHKIQEAINSLDEILSERPFPVSIMVATSEDESVMIGTNQAVIWLASRLLKALQDVNRQQAQRMEFDGYEAQCVVLEAVFNSLGHIVPNSLCVTNSDDDSREVVKFFQRINP